MAKKPHLGMKYLQLEINKVFRKKLKNKIKSISIYGYNPFEITHFKHGFQIKPNFYNKRTYNQGLISQLEYQSKRLKVMLKSFLF